MRRSLLLISFAALAFSTAARADLSISNKPTQNIDCQAGVCTATAQKAVLNAGELQAMLASGDVAVKSGVLAKDVDIDQPLTWSSTSRLTLDAQRSVTVKKQVTVAGQGALTVTTNDTGAGKKSDGEFIIVPEHGSVQLWDLGSSLIIDGNSYNLVNDIKTLASDIADNPSGFYALAKSYDASVDGAYSSAPVDTALNGYFEGLGNTISGLLINDTTQDVDGLFGAILSDGHAQNLGVTNASVTNLQADHSGVVAAGNLGKMTRCWASGVLSFESGAYMGGLVAFNGGSITASYSTVKMEGSRGARESVGGLVGQNSGMITTSYAMGLVSFASSHDMNFGGLVGLNQGIIESSFTRSKIKTAHGKKADLNADIGGLVGKNGTEATISTSYAAGEMATESNSGVGGFVGVDNSLPGSISAAYWDFDMGISDPNQGAGNIPNDPGIIGLTDAQLKSGLPEGFDPKIWGIDPRINNGYPYLLAKPPQ